MGCMDNGHVYPSDYALRFSRRTEHPATHHAIVDELRQHYPTDWPHLIGTIFAHREACLLAALAAIAERGPEAVSIDKP
jgi:hypothetical protein